MYRDVTGWESFEPWLSCLEKIEAQRIWEIAETVPPEWYENEVGVLEQLVEKLIERRSRVRDWIAEFRESSREPFPKWNGKGVGMGVRQFAETEWGDNVDGGGRVM